MYIWYMQALPGSSAVERLTEAEEAKAPSFDHVNQNVAGSIPALAAKLDERTCYDCKQTKKLTAFCKDSRKEGRYTFWCLECKRKWDHEYHRRNKHNVKQSRESLIKKNQHFVLDYLRQHPCIDCGESDPVVLEFDHVKDTKLMAVSKMIRTFSTKAIELEISKCVVRCANCHRRATASRSLVWFKAGKTTT